MCLIQINFSNASVLSDCVEYDIVILFDVWYTNEVSKWCDYLFISTLVYLTTKEGSLNCFDTSLSVLQ